MGTALKDTAAGPAAVQEEAFRRMGPDGRMRAAFGMSEEMRQVLEDGVRARHPEYSADAVRLAAIRILLDDDALFRAVFPAVQVEP